MTKLKSTNEIQNVTELSDYYRDGRLLFDSVSK